MEDKWRRVCLICRDVWGNPNGKTVNTFCEKCLKEVKNEQYLTEWNKQKEERENAIRTRTQKD